MNGIAVLLPTRNRPILLERFIDSVYATATHKDLIKIYLYVDLDDSTTWKCFNSLNNKYPNKIHVLVGPRIVMSEMVNKLYPLIKEDIFFLGGDDLIMKTEGWDTLIINKFNDIDDKIALLFGDDTIQIDLATHPIIHRRWVEALGYITPPYFSSDYADTWLNEIADSLDRKYKLPFVNEHTHWVNGKNNFDSTYLENRVRFQKDNPHQIFSDLKNVRLKDVEKLRRIINEK